MPTPRKERFLASHRDELNIPFIMGVGGSFDVLAGQIRRAPTRLQALGLEWLYRVYQEPRRMWWRYAKTNALFAVDACAGHHPAQRACAAEARRCIAQVNSTQLRG